MTLDDLGKLIDGHLDRIDEANLRWSSLFKLLAISCGLELQIFGLRLQNLWYRLRIVRNRTLLWLHRIPTE